tara:strand:- start:47 stop:154 length:108 start_codon:yes stop_codon:yes gene_type:complete
MKAIIFCLFVILCFAAFSVNKVEEQTYTFEIVPEN